MALSETLNLESLGVAGVTVTVLLYVLHTRRVDSKEEIAQAREDNEILRQELKDQWSFIRDRDEKYREDIQKMSMTAEKLVVTISALKDALK